MSHAELPIESEMHADEVNWARATRQMVLSASFISDLVRLLKTARLRHPAENHSVFRCRFAEAQP